MYVNRASRQWPWLMQANRAMLGVASYSKLYPLRTVWPSKAHSILGYSEDPISHNISL